MADATVLAKLMHDRFVAEEDLFKFYEKIPEEQRPAIYEQAHVILRAQSERDGTPAVAIQ